MSKHGGVLISGIDKRLGCGRGEFESAGACGEMAVGLSWGPRFSFGDLELL